MLTTRSYTISFSYTIQQALKMLRTPELKPYIINIKAPPFERLKETRHRAYARSTFDETSSRSFTVSSSHLLFRSEFLNILTKYHQKVERRISKEFWPCIFGKPDIEHVVLGRFWRHLLFPKYERFYQISSKFWIENISY